MLRRDLFEDMPGNERVITIAQRIFLIAADWCVHIASTAVLTAKIKITEIAGGEKVLRQNISLSGLSKHSSVLEISFLVSVKSTVLVAHILGFTGNKRKRLHNNRVQLPEDWVGTPTHGLGFFVWRH